MGTKQGFGLDPDKFALLIDSPSDKGSAVVIKRSRSVEKHRLHTVYLGIKVVSGARDENVRCYLGEIRH